MLFSATFSDGSSNIQAEIFLKFVHQKYQTFVILKCLKMT